MERGVEQWERRAKAHTSVRIIWKEGGDILCDQNAQGTQSLL